MYSLAYVYAGGLDHRDNITFLGRLFSVLPLDIKLSKLLLLGITILLPLPVHYKELCIKN